MTTCAARALLFWKQRECVREPNAWLMLYHARLYLELADKGVANLSREDWDAYCGNVQRGSSLFWQEAA